MIRELKEKIFPSRKYWEERAKQLKNKQYYVGRTDIYSYTPNLKGEPEYVHHVYSILNGCIKSFTGSPARALKNAVLYAEKLNDR